MIVAAFLGLAIVGVAASDLSAQPEFRFKFSGPDILAGPAGSTVEGVQMVQLETTGIAAGSPGAQGWSFGVASTGACTIVDASTFGTASATVRNGGLRQNGFEITELTTGAGNEGVVSAVVLSSTLPVTLDPGRSPHDVLRLVLDARVSRESCERCELVFRGDLRGRGQPVPLLVTYQDRSFDPDGASKALRICPLPCGPSDLLGWNLRAIGDANGTGRFIRESIALCGSSLGYSDGADSIYTAANTAMGDFSLVAVLESIEDDGLGGLEARAFTGTTPEDTTQVVRVSVVRNANGRTQLVSSARVEDAGDHDNFGTEPVEVDLPLLLRVQRIDGIFETAFAGADGRFRTHLTVRADRGLSPRSFRLALVQSSLSRRIDANSQLHASTAIFSKPELTSEIGAFPPILGRLRFPGNSLPQIGEPTIVEIPGANLETAREVLVAGSPAKIIEVEPQRLLVEVPAFDGPVRGDVLVRTPGGEAVLPNAFFAYARPFTRCDCDGNRRSELTDAIRMLGFQFLGLPPCVCPRSGDCNNDGTQNLTDPISLLSYLFLGGPQPPAPFLNPGLGEDGGGCDSGSDTPIILEITADRLTDGDIFTIKGSGFSPDLDANKVVGGDADFEILEASETELLVRVNRIITEAEVNIGVIRDFGIFIFNCHPRRCFPLWIGPVDFLPRPIPLFPIERLEIAGRSRSSDDGGFVIQLDREVFSPNSSVRQFEVQIEAFINVQSVPGFSPGARRVKASHSFGDLNGAEAIEDLARALERELAGGGFMNEFMVEPDVETAQIRILPTERLKELLEAEAIPFPFGNITLLWPPLGRCGPTNLHPINDEREFGWCRFEEVVKPCNGLPAFEWFIPVGEVMSASGTLSNVHPNDRSPSNKGRLYNRSAYCHVRKHGLWDNCKLDDLISNGKTKIPPFPRDAWVMKTSWKSESSMLSRYNAAVTEGASLPAFNTWKNQFYSYVYSGDGVRYYLAALHHTTKDIDEWFWMDIYMPLQRQGIGGCGGSNLDAPAGIAAGIWQHYFLCTNVTETQPITSDGFAGVGPNTTNSGWCGNFAFSPECPPAIDSTPGDTCLNCHDSRLPNVSNPIPSPFGGARYNGVLELDFLYSLDNSSKSNPCQ